MTENKLTLVNHDASTSGTQPQTKDTIMGFVPIILIFGIFYFFIIRPQMKKQKDQQNLIKSAKKGDKVIVAGGMIGTIVKEKDADIIVVEVAKNLNIEVLKSTILNILNKTIGNEDKETSKSKTKKPRAKTAKKS